MRISDWSSDVCSSDLNEATVTAEHIQRDRRFCVNLLSERQIAVSQLCSRGNAPKFIDEAFLERTALPGGVIMPVLRESIASFECRAATITTSGTHLIVIGAIEATIASPTLESRLYGPARSRSESHTAAIPSLMHISYAGFCLTNKSKD